MSASKVNELDRRAGWGVGVIDWGSVRGHVMVQSEVAMMSVAWFIAALKA